MSEPSMQNIISEQCQQLRKQIRTERKSLTDDEQAQASSQLLNRLIAHPKVQQAQKVSLTLPFDGEVDITPFIHWCWQQQKQVYLPVVAPTQKGTLLFIHYHEQSEMLTNRYGIQEPTLTSASETPHLYTNTTPANELDIVFTPLVAFDQNGHRIGMGGGYYDRLLTPWFENKSGPYPIGLAHNCQYREKIPTQPWDVPLPEVLTPAKHFIF